MYSKYIRLLKHLIFIKDTFLQLWESCMHICGWQMLTFLGNLWVGWFMVFNVSFRHIYGRISDRQKFETCRQSLLLMDRLQGVIYVYAISFLNTTKPLINQFVTIVIHQVICPHRSKPHGRRALNILIKGGTSHACFHRLRSLHLLELLHFLGGFALIL